MDDYIVLANEPPPPPPPKPIEGVQIPRFKIPGEPERYRLPAAAIEGARTERLPHPKTVHFRFRTRSVSATGAFVDSYHPNVLRLRIHPSSAQRVIGLVTNLFPRRICSFVKSAFPEWFLPDNLILKKERDGKEDEYGDPDELMDMEVKAYKKLKSLQGIVIPNFYGQVRFNEARAIILQDIGGVSLAEPAGATLDFDTFSTLLQECCCALQSCGVTPEDHQLGNFVLVENKIMAVDLEMVSFDKPTEYTRTSMWNGITWMARLYRDRRAYLRKQGLLEAA
ncbi:hypothetical protein AK830_g7458 [Neonectria ditissima]|uniref:Uncharacterized protein n=1 Tax=Neonectria ditissima TaxID=78410 RepID=A0A0P7BA60_9HYPO|nr:hypothetical protein AK830_g7458 [Neonectria ditissima]